MIKYSCPTMGKEDWFYHPEPLLAFCIRELTVGFVALVRFGTGLSNMVALVLRSC